MPLLPGKAHKILVAHNGAMKTKVRCSEYGPTKTVPHTGPILVGMEGYRVLAQLDATAPAVRAAGTRTIADHARAIVRHGGERALPYFSSSSATASATCDTARC